MKKIYTIISLSIMLIPLLVFANNTDNMPNNIAVTRNGNIAELSWNNPSNTNFSKTIVFSSTIPIEAYFSYEAVDGLCDKIYEGIEETYTDTSLAENLDYYFIFFSSDKTGNYSKAIVIEKKAYTNDTKTKNTKTENTSSSTKIITLANAASKYVNEVSLHEAGIIYNFNKSTSIKPGSNSNRLALFIMVKSPHDLNEKDKNAISYFIDQGTPTTIVLGAGERTGVLNSYLSVFNKLPRNILEWQDVIKIANGRWPNEKNIEREKQASNTFFNAIYQRNPDMNNPNDNAAVTVIAYGLRPANRNMKSEAKAIKIYTSIFKKAPIEATDWDLVRAIAYSGAVR